MVFVWEEIANLLTKQGTESIIEQVKEDRAKVRSELQKEVASFLKEYKYTRLYNQLLLEKADQNNLQGTDEEKIDSLKNMFKQEYLQELSAQASSTIALEIIKKFSLDEEVQESVANRLSETNSEETLAEVTEKIFEQRSNRLDADVMLKRAELLRQIPGIQVQKGTTKIDGKEQEFERTHVITGVYDASHSDKSYFKYDGAELPVFTFDVGPFQVEFYQTKISAYGDLPRENKEEYAIRISGRMPLNEALDIAERSFHLYELKITNTGKTFSNQYGNNSDSSFVANIMKNYASESRIIIEEKDYFNQILQGLSEKEREDSLEKLALAKESLEAIRAKMQAHILEESRLNISFSDKDFRFLTPYKDFIKKPHEVDFEIAFSGLIETNSYNSGDCEANFRIAANLIITGDEKTYNIKRMSNFLKQFKPEEQKHGMLKKVYNVLRGK